MKGVTYMNKPIVHIPYSYKHEARQRKAIEKHRLWVIEQCEHYRTDWDARNKDILVES